MTTELKDHYPAGQLSDYIEDLKAAMAPALTTDLAVRWYDQNDSRQFIRQEILEKIDGTDFYCSPRADLLTGHDTAHSVFCKLLMEWLEAELTKLLPPLLGALAEHRLSRRDSRATGIQHWINTQISKGSQK